MQFLCVTPACNASVPCQEADRKILAALLEGEQDDRRIESARRERAVADAAWMKQVIEEQLELEREREAEFDILYRSVQGSREVLLWGRDLCSSSDKSHGVSSFQGGSPTRVGETGGRVGEGEESQRAAHA